MSEEKGRAVDFGSKQRYIYIVLCIVGSLLSYYMRTLYYAQMSYSFKGCPTERFDRPWFGTLVMAIGMALCLVVYLIWLKIDPTHGPKLLDIPLKLYLYAFIPAISDMLYSLFYSYSIVNSGTISIALRYFELIFVVIVNYFFFRPPNYLHQWIALGIVFIGVILVVISVLVSANSPEKVLASAVILQIVAQLAHAFKTNTEQKIIHYNDVCPWWLTGVEGIYQFAFILFGFDPIAYLLPEAKFESLHEDFCSSFMMAIHSGTILILFLIYLPICTTYNGSLIGTIMTTNAITYTIVEMIGTSIGWITDIIIFHGFHGKLILPSNGMVFGTQWTKYSYIRVIGAVIFFIGFLIYSGIIRFPCFTYPEANVRLIPIQNYGITSEVLMI